ncbi:MAG: SIS domain-containing protein [Clostridia bacterium]|nr:SIS domain-containing protein [Clostridia bacterium]
MFKTLFAHYPELQQMQPELGQAMDLLIGTIRQGGKILICGNGGSAADAAHISGELLKGFLLRRPVDPEPFGFLPDPDRELLSKGLQGGLPVIPLPSFEAALSAFANDADPDLGYAQLTFALGNEKDLLWGISTSGNSKNILYAVEAAKVRGMKTLGMTGQGGGKMRALCDCTLCVPAKETYRVQEYHLPVYHAICAGLEAEFFE